MTKNQGLSLIEILISLLISSVLMTLMMQQFLVVKRQYGELRLVLTEILEVDLVSELLRSSLRSAGFTPCRGIDSLQTRDINNTRLRAVQTQFGKNKTLKISRMDEAFSTLLEQRSPTQFLVRSNRAYEAKQKILIADCSHAEVLELMKTKKTKAGMKLSFRKAPTFIYSPPIYLGEWIEEEYFIKKNPQGLTALFYKLKDTEEISDLFSDLQVKLKKKKEVDIELSLKNGQNFNIKTVVRSG